MQRHLDSLNHRGESQAINGSRRRLLIGAAATLALSSCDFDRLSGLTPQQAAAIEQQDYTAEYGRMVRVRPTERSIENTERLFYVHEQALEDYEDQLFEHHNQVREDLGLKPLSRDDELNMLADLYSREMSIGEFFEHHPDFTSGVSSSWHRLGENIGKGPFTAEGQAEVLEAFLASPGHYANITRESYTHIGIGAIPQAQNDGKGVLITVRFGARDE